MVRFARQELREVRRWEAHPRAVPLLLARQSKTQEWTLPLPVVLKPAPEREESGSHRVLPSSAAREFGLSSASREFRCR